MSSKMKDARWGLAIYRAKSLGLEYEHFTYEGWQIMLDKAQHYLDTYPNEVGDWAEKFGEVE